jgi:hypothetical protein
VLKASLAFPVQAWLILGKALIRRCKFVETTMTGYQVPNGKPPPSSTSYNSFRHHAGRTDVFPKFDKINVLSDQTASQLNMIRWLSWARIFPGGWLELKTALDPQSFSIIARN